MTEKSSVAFLETVESDNVRAHLALIVLSDCRHPENRRHRSSQSRLVAGLGRWTVPE